MLSKIDPTFIYVTKGKYKGKFGQIVRRTRKMVHIQFYHDSDIPLRRLLKTCVIHVDPATQYALISDICRKIKVEINQITLQLTNCEVTQVNESKKICQQIKELRTKVDNKVLLHLLPQEAETFHMQCFNTRATVTVKETQVLSVQRFWRDIKKGCYDAMTYLQNKWKNHEGIPRDHSVHELVRRLDALDNV